LGEKGFHFCRIPFKVCFYYSGDNCKYAEISASGKIVEDNDYNCVCNQIEIIKELSLGEIYECSSGLFIRKDGTKRYYLNGKSHRLDGPAIKNSNSDKEWWIYGRRHRLDGPAIEYINGIKQWWVNGELHRLDGPAIENCESKKWYLNGKLSRLYGPAIEYTNGDFEWFLNKKRHRLDGPAIENADGTKEWWVYGRRYCPVK
jgi:hypothetical protein